MNKKNSYVIIYYYHNILLATLRFLFPKTLIVLFVCLAFVGQAMASTSMAYQMIGMKVMNAQPQDMSMMDHSDHIMASDSTEQSENTKEDCCTSSCKCSAGGCSMVIAFIKGIAGNGPVANFSAKIFSSSSLALSQQPASLYRPPILS
ncbi:MULTISPECIES: CopL family metal-binding regulatory protein [unclassified Colwellia]|uniref:CopL family metal-binding regulatory protein n=1 Tax=unclassified Colwellia TaxID=196834 RepID=UPI002872F2EB|nr:MULTISPECIES: CopL family metal-binding regulatory protein [unclassified Colwellia]